MKSFDEWFEEKYKNSNLSEISLHRFRLDTFDAWQAAQEVQRESDAKIVLYHEDYFIYEKIRNNKAV